MIADTETLVCEDIKRRQQLGLAKYRTSVARNPLELRQWLQHAYEEALDQAIYMQRAMQQMDATCTGAGGCLKCAHEKRRNETYAEPGTAGGWGAA